MKSEIERFIADAIAGGWRPFPQFDDNMNTIEGVMAFGGTPDRHLLDPLAWQAVGKTRGWGNDYTDGKVGNASARWLVEQHCFIDHLADGKTIEEALTAIG